MAPRQLRPYQVDGVEYLVKHNGGFLWDDPGLGKTTQAIFAASMLLGNAHARAKSEKGVAEVGPILVVCPNALKNWWRKEIAEVMPEHRPFIAVAGTGGRFPVIGDSGRPIEVRVEDLYYGSSWYAKRVPPLWIVVHYEGLRLSLDSFQTIPWSVVIADECHYIKNRNAARTQAVWNVTPDGSGRIGLTATPYSQFPDEIWAQLYWKSPNSKGLQSYWKFLYYFVETSDEYNPRTGGSYKKKISAKNEELLAKVMDLYGLRRSKAIVASQLPPLTYTDMPLQSEGRQASILEALEERDRVEVNIMQTKCPFCGGKLEFGDGGVPTVSGGDPSEADPGTPPIYCPDCGKGWTEHKELPITQMLIKNVLSRFTKMERWLSHPWAFDPGVKGAKMEWLEDWSAEFKYPAVIVTRFKESAKGIAKFLKVDPVTGDIPQKLRDGIVERWQKGESQYLVGTIHTLGTGLNLDRAWTMVCFDQVHQTTLMEQVQQRIHRLTTDHPVEVIHLYLEGTSNEVVLESFKNKWKDLEFVRAMLEYIQTKRMASPSAAVVVSEGEEVRQEAFTVDQTMTSASE